MKSDKLACETIRWLVTQVAADCLELVAEPPPPFPAIPIGTYTRFLRLLAVNRLPWTEADVDETIGLIHQAKLIVTNHRPLISAYSKVTIQHQQRSERVLEELRFVQALDIITGWEIAQPTRAGYIELGFISEQVAREALLVIFSTPRYYSAAKTRLGIMKKMGNYTSPF